MVIIILEISIVGGSNCYGQKCSNRTRWSILGYFKDLIANSPLNFVVKPWSTEVNSCLEKEFRCSWTSKLTLEVESQEDFQDKDG